MNYNLYCATEFDILRLISWNYLLKLILHH